MCHARRKRPGTAAHDQSNDLFSHCFRFELNRQRRTPDRPLCRRKTMAPNPKDFSNGFGTIWSGTPGSNRRPSPWQGADEDVHRDATGVKSLESETLAEPASSAVLQADAAGIN